MADNTIIQQGYFTADGLDKIIPLRSDVDWVEVYNLTNIAAATQWAATTWTWQRELAQDDSILTYHAAATQAISMSTSAVGYNGAVYRGISLIDSSDLTIGGAIAVTAGTNATQPVYSTANTGRLVAGSIVRIQNTAHTNLNGLDFSVDTVVLNTSFRLANTVATAPGVIAGAAGTWRYVAPSQQVYDMIHPKDRVIANITAANPGVVRTLVDHGYVTGQRVKLSVPAVNGMIELDGQEVTVTRVNASTFSIGVDTTAYTAFTFPLPASVPFTPAQVVPIATDVAYAPSTNISQKNSAFIGIVLGTSSSAAIALGSPAGTNGDVIKWRAGKSFATHVPVLS